ncbi:MAG: hypothetical protein KGH75_00415 [Rhodospirillales bacterium]|nr:hypothetical protein [Rhodospirillales bacterium]
MTVALAVMAALWLVLLMAYLRLLARYRQATARTWTVPVRHASGALPPTPFDLDVAGQQLVVVAVADAGLVVRKREWHDRIRRRWRSAVYRLRDRTTTVTDRWSTP